MPAGGRNDALAARPPLHLTLCGHPHCSTHWGQLCPLPGTRPRPGKPRPFLHPSHLPSPARLLTHPDPYHLTRCEFSHFRIPGGSLHPRHGLHHTPPLPGPERSPCLYLGSESLCFSVMSDSLQFHGLWPPGSTVCRILQARILEWVAILSPGALPDPEVEPMSPSLAGRFFTTEPPRKP